MDDVLRMLRQTTTPAIRVGLSGPPGAGKSTFIEALGTYLTTKANKRVAVLVMVIPKCGLQSHYTMQDR